MDKQKSWNRSAYYKITIRGELGDEWADWFEGMTITLQKGNTCISGEVDQAALHGLFARIRDLGIPLISVSMEGNNSINKKI